MEEKGTVARGCLPPEPRVSAGQREAVVPRQRAARGGGPPAGGGGLRREPGDNPFLLHVAPCTSGSQSQSSFPLQFNSFSTMAEITHTTILVVEIPETSENPTQSSLN